MRDSFKALITELKKIEEAVCTATATGSPVEGSLLAELCRHLCQFVHARQELIDLYLFTFRYQISAISFVCFFYFEHYWLRVLSFENVKRGWAIYAN